MSEDNIQLGNMKETAALARTARNSVPAGSYRAKLIGFSKERTLAGQLYIAAEWLILEVFGSNGDASLEDCMKSKGKKMRMKFYIQDEKNAEINKQKMAQCLDEVLKGTGLDLGQYQTLKDLEQLFLELNSYAIIKELVGKPATNKQFTNWHVRKDRSSVSSPAQPQAANNWANNAPAPAPAPAQSAPAQSAPAPAPAPTSPKTLAPSSAASALFTE